MARIALKSLIDEAKQRGIRVTQKDLAKEAGVSNVAISKIVRGQTKAPDPEILLAIADFFSEKLGRSVTLNDLIEREDGEEPDLSDTEFETYRKQAEEDLNDIMRMYVEAMQLLQETAKEDPERAAPFIRKWRQIYEQALEEQKQLRAMS